MADEAGLRASRIELDRAGPSYTVDTLAALREAHPGSALFLIVGQDMLVDIVNWRRPGEILSMAGLLAVPRPGVHPKLPPTLTGHFSMLPFPENELSSTEVRGRLARGEEVSNLLAPAVLRIIKEKDLYHAAGEDAAL